VDTDLECELVVADWHSDDWPLDLWLAEAASPLPVQILEMEGGFSRGKGLNAAARAARGEVLFFLDTDALVCRQVLRRGLQHVRDGKAYFPIVYALGEEGNAEGRWRDGGYGHCFLAKDFFERLGGWPEYCYWGREDKEFWAKVSSLQPAVREQVQGFYHQWHPEDIDWKNRYGEETEAFQELKERVQAAESEVARARAVMAQVDTLLPRRSRYVLVDEDRFAEHGDLGGRAVPFLEKDGQYWGIPADDATALSELKRLHAAGARFVVVPWIGFWWLTHFTQLNTYLRTSSTIMIETDAVIIFDLGEPASWQ
jgi:hypothetical protein